MRFLGLLLFGYTADTLLCLQPASNIRTILFPVFFPDVISCKPDLLFTRQPGGGFLIVLL